MSAPDPNIRLSNTQREALIARLHAATEEGRLDLDEFAERSRQVYEAKPYGDVERLLADLSDDDRALAVPSRSKAVTDVPDLVLNPVHNRVERNGDWTVPARITTKGSLLNKLIGGRVAAGRLARMDPMLDLMLAGNDVLSIGAMNEFRRLGIAVPERIAVSGVDDIPLARDVTPSLTTVALPFAEAGRVALEMALAPDTARDVHLPGTLIVRESALAGVSVRPK